MEYAACELIKDEYWLIFEVAVVIIQLIAKIWLIVVAYDGGILRWGIFGRWSTSDEREGIPNDMVVCRQSELHVKHTQGLSMRQRYQGTQLRRNPAYLANRPSSPITFLSPFFDTVSPGKDSSSDRSYIIRPNSVPAHNSTRASAPPYKKKNTATFSAITTQSGSGVSNTNQSDRIKSKQTDNFYNVPDGTDNTQDTNLPGIFVGCSSPVAEDVPPRTDWSIHGVYPCTQPP
jgi:hypothetical protein